jgi:pimeloyl-ACP methyl ester carboxylesterase
MSAIILDNEIIHYEVLGRGRPVVFLHGWVGSWRYWIPNMQAASTNYRAYAIDLWGFGDTAKNAQKYLLDQQIALLDDFLAEMGIEKIAIIGHGLGAVIGLLFADRYPHYVERFMAVALPFDRKMINLRLEGTSPGELADWLIGDTSDYQSIHIEALKADPRAIFHSINNLESIQITELSQQIDTPSLLVYGHKDPAIEMINHHHLIQLPDHFHQISFYQSGHFPMLDEGSKFNRLMNDFLNLPSGESPQRLQLKEEWKRRIR